ncbi:MBL fold metallo-hydrolase [Mucilaginibacter terrae]|uniref:Glyoxylase-like metal-dependent hydrolase (Beta-lactamase superfamily II) n=1 Tax=Mucilaginibacter terrae TaxID=1955052 RepID=A0ABU3GSJ1_9SPHI|nr:MBL fold metallo-hydrolase [Mucilaginibacter terrae]MDT3401630.1 glyoxylase-like metal-dependent hydrolase (beta-lactamase superfamily II) [Mucilaginibacter terrae]
MSINLSNPATLQENSGAELFTINTGLFKLDGGAMFGVVPKTIWSKTNPADENNLCTLAMRCLLVKDNDRLILIDTGIGTKLSDKVKPFYHLHGDDTLEKSLASYGFTPDDITDVLLTHLHLDHVGGAVIKYGEQLLPAFKNATYWTNEEHWQWATENPNDREKASFLKENLEPLQQSGRLKFVKIKDGIQFSPNIKLHFVSGHTHAMMLPLINYKGRQIFFIADLVPTTGHLPIAYVASYDIHPLQAMAEKKTFLQQALDNKYVLFFEHDAINECCTLQQTEKGIRIKDLIKLTHI